MVLDLDTRTYSEKLPVRLKLPPTFCRLGAEKRDTWALLMLRELFTTWRLGIFRLEKSPKEVSKLRDMRLGKSIMAPGALSEMVNSPRPVATIDPLNPKCIWLISVLFVIAEKLDS
jgi:hypothetical protein